MEEIEKLKQKEEELRHDLRCAQLKRETLQRQHQLPKLKKELEGKYFKYRNCYSCPEKPSDYWWLYKFVIEVKGEYECMVKQFQNTGSGISEYEIHTHCSVNTLRGCTPIRKSEYMRAFKKFISKIKP